MVGRRRLRGGRARRSLRPRVTPVAATQISTSGNDQPVSDYTGLVKGETYYAYDPATKEHWAGAALVAGKGSTQAQVGNQDDGAYQVFRQKGDGGWRAWDAGIPAAPASAAP